MVEIYKLIRHYSNPTAIAPSDRTARDAVQSAVEFGITNSRSRSTIEQPLALLITSLSLVLFWVWQTRSDVSHSLLNSQQMFVIVSILTKTPGHDTPQAEVFHNLGELLCDKSWGVPGPENICRGVPKVLAAVLGV